MVMTMGRGRGCGHGRGHCRGQSHCSGLMAITALNLGDRQYPGIYPGPCIRVSGQNSSTQAISDLGVSRYAGELARGLLLSLIHI